MLEWFVFIFGSLFLAYVSRASLPVVGSHGFYRFFAWELMLLLAVANLDGWYAAPLTPDQIASGILMAASLFLALMGYLTLLIYGGLSNHRSEAHLLEFERTTLLVTHGVFRHIRHPMYTSLLLLDWGLYFKQMNWLHCGIALAASALLIHAALVEERENIRYFGSQYRDYIQRSKRFVPFLF